MLDDFCKTTSLDDGEEIAAIIQGGGVNAAKFNIGGGEGRANGSGAGNIRSEDTFTSQASRPRRLA